MIGHNEDNSFNNEKGDKQMINKKQKLDEVREESKGFTTS